MASRYYDDGYPKYNIPLKNWELTIGKGKTDGTLDNGFDDEHVIQIPAPEHGSHVIYYKNGSLEEEWDSLEAFADDFDVDVDTLEDAANLAKEEFGFYGLTLGSPINIAELLDNVNEDNVVAWLEETEEVNDTMKFLIEEDIRLTLYGPIDVHGQREFVSVEVTDNYNKKEQEIWKLQPQEQESYWGMLAILGLYVVISNPISGGISTAYAISYLFFIAMTQQLKEVKDEV